MRALRALALGAALATSGCTLLYGDARNPVEASDLGADLAVDLSGVDLAGMDLAGVDLTPGADDLSTPDLAPLCDPPSLPASVTGPNLSIKLSNVQLNGGTNVAQVASGALFSLKANYSLNDTGCCVDQIIVGIAPNDAQACLFNAVVPAGGTTGTATVSLRAPIAPGTYTLRFHYGQATMCDLTWWTVNGAPTSTVDVAAICVP